MLKINNKIFEKINGKFLVFDKTQNLYTHFENFIASEGRDEIKIFLLNIKLNNDKTKVIGFKLHFQCEKYEIDDKKIFQLESLDKIDDCFKEMNSFIQENFHNYKKKDLIIEYIKTNILRLFHPEEMKYPYSKFEKEDKVNWIDSLPF